MPGGQDPPEARVLLERVARRDALPGALRADGQHQGREVPRLRADHRDPRRRNGRGGPALRQRARAYISEVSVDAVELYTTVTDKGRPVPGLQASNFKVFEDGVIQKIESFEYVKNLPISLGVMIDTSASMLEIASGGGAGGDLVPRLLDRPEGPRLHGLLRQRALHPVQAHQPQGQALPLDGRPARRGLDGPLRRDRLSASTSSPGVKGKKALVILTDGKDTASKFDFDTMLEYVRKSGISIYGIGLKISGADLEVKYKLNKIANVTRRPDLLHRLRQAPRRRLQADQRGAAQPVPADLLLDQPRAARTSGARSRSRSSRRASRRGRSPGTTRSSIVV